jgi:hypothetical protein
MTLFAQLAAAQTNPLGFFKNYLVTGDYVVGGAGIRGTGDASGYSAGTSITIPDTNYQPNAASVPSGANIVAAFLYWQTVEKSQSAFAGQTGFFNGYPVIGKVLGNPSAPVSWSAGGCSGSANGATVVRTYRVDVRPYLNAGGNGTYPVRLADSGSNGGGTPLTLGASLVVIYRIMSPGVPLSAVTLYDGSYAPSNGALGTSQSIGGFYDSASRYAKITHIVGNGQPNKGELVYLNSVNLPSLYSSYPSTPFPGIYGGSWDNPTWTPANYAGAPLTVGDSSATASVTPSTTNSGCVSWGAIILSVPVEDSDGDGLLDAWENGGGYTDFGTGQWTPLPGAAKNVRDIYVQLDYMTNAGTATGAIPHSHLPKQAALDLVGKAFGNAPLPIRLHFDVGNNYGCLPGSATCGSDPYLFNGSGGNHLDEDATACTDVPSSNFYCQFPNQSGLMGWKSGITLMKNQFFAAGRKDSYHYVLFGHNLAAPAVTATLWKISDGSLISVSCCQAPAGANWNTIVTTGSPLPSSIVQGARVTVSNSLAALELNRTYLVKQVLSANSFAISTAQPAANPPLASAVAPGTYGPTPPANSTTIFADTTLTVSYLSPGAGGVIPVRSISGWSDLGGADSMVMLGSWPSDFTSDNQTGSVQVQAGTLMHELGHTLGLTHGGTYYDASGNPSYGSNCKAIYQSIMNYEFQIRGLTLGAVDYSRQVLTPLLEGNLMEAPGLTDTAGFAPFYSTTRWYAPLGFFQFMTNTQDGQTAIGATMHCDGTPLSRTETTPMVKIEGSVSPLGTWIDWNNNGLLTSSAITQDVTFNGSIDPAPLMGFNDWAVADLRQIGARRNVLAFSGGLGGNDLASGGGNDLLSGGGNDLASGGGNDLASGGGNDLASGGGNDLASGGGNDQ